MKNKYLCPCCNSGLINKEEYYICDNPKCGLRESQIEITEDWHDVFVCDTETEEVKVENKWCTIIKIAHEQEVTI